MVYFSEQGCTELNNKIKKWRLLLITVSAVAVAGFAVIVLLATYNSNTWAVITGSILLSFLGCFVIFVLFNIILPARRILKLGEKVLSRRGKRMTGKVDNVKENVTVDKGITADIVSIEGYKRSYYFARPGTAPACGKTIKFTEGCGYCIEWEAADE